MKSQTDHACRALRLVSEARAIQRIEASYLYGRVVKPKHIFSSEDTCFYYKFLIRLPDRKLLVY